MTHITEVGNSGCPNKKESIITVSKRLGLSRPQIDILKKKVDEKMKRAKAFLTLIGG